MRGSEPGNDNKNGEDLPTERGNKREEGVYGGSSSGDFPGGSGVRALCFQCRGHQSTPGPRIKIPTSLQVQCGQNMAQVLTPKIIESLKYHYLSKGKERGRAVWGEKIWGLAEFMGLVRHLPEDIQKISDMQEFVSKMGNRRHLTMVMILAAALQQVLSWPRIYISH